MWIFSQQSRTSFKAGFTLIELMVVISLMVVITGLLLFRQSKFNSSTILRALTYSAALTVRQAQLYGTSVRESINTSGGSTFSSNYGVYYSSGSTANYTLFADTLSNDGVYTNASGNCASGEDCPVKTYRLPNNYSLSKFCGVLASDATGNTTHCSTGGSPITWMTVYFTRPNTDSQFKTSASGVDGAYSKAVLTVSAADNNFRNIIITTTGQISICAANVAYPSC